MTHELWYFSIDRRPADRTVQDIAVIVSYLRHLAALTGVPPLLLSQLASVAYLEQLDSGVTLYRQGDRGTSWYAVLMGTLDVHVSKTGIVEDMNAVSRSLGMGSFFGESILDDSPRENTIVTREPCQLLRVEQRDFRALWQELLSPLSSQSQSKAEQRVASTSVILLAEDKAMLIQNVIMWSF
ncbi:Rap guanine nucleotide exchange factor 4 [Folsomia candida]|uniref:Rap guanine nucleotide exchange factor 4 n=1 Tax=Folsomia candida TaxID=158441 RepID=A0A226EK29_FOLCA|nr:Rap guanine nucleotide exchange factor 4 [Folsomia candida]